MLLRKIARQGRDPWRNGSGNVRSSCPNSPTPRRSGGWYEKHQPNRLSAHPNPGALALSSARATTRGQPHAHPNRHPQRERVLQPPLPRRDIHRRHPSHHRALAQAGRIAAPATASSARSWPGFSRPWRCRSEGLQLLEKSTESPASPLSFLGSKSRFCPILHCVAVAPYPNAIALASAVDPRIEKVRRFNQVGH